MDILPIQKRSKETVNTIFTRVSRTEGQIHLFDKTTGTYVHCYSVQGTNDELDLIESFYNELGNANTMLESSYFTLCRADTVGIDKIPNSGVRFKTAQ